MGKADDSQWRDEQSAMNLAASHNGHMQGARAVSLCAPRLITSPEAHG